MTIKMLMAAAAAALCTVPMAQAQNNLTGSQVTAAIYCCDAPNEANRATNLVTKTVGPDVEFPNGTFTSVIAGLSPVAFDLDVGANTVDLHYLESAPAAPGTFDGFILSFQGAPTITNVTVDPSSTLTPRSVTFDGSTIFINNADLALTPQSRVLLNVAVVPEPAQAALMLGGLATVGLLARRRRQRVGQGRNAG